MKKKVVAILCSATARFNTVSVEKNVYEANVILQESDEALLDKRNLTPPENQKCSVSVVVLSYNPVCMFSC